MTRLMPTTLRASLVMPCFNEENGIGTTLDELRSKLADLEPYELIVVDDGSTDGSLEIARGFAAADSRVRIDSPGRIGLVAALNRGIAQARGELIARMDADDVALPHRLERQVAFLDARPDVAALGSSALLIDEAGRRIGVRHLPVDPTRIAEALRSGRNMLVHAAVTMRRAAVVEAGGYDDLFRHSEDYDLWLRLAERFAVANLPEPLLLHRIHPNRVTVRHRLDQIVAAMAAAAASRLRRAGQPDPLRGARSLSGALLRQIPLSKGESSVIQLELARFILSAMQEGDEEAIGRATALARDVSPLWDLGSPQATAAALIEDAGAPPPLALPATLARLALARRLAAARKPVQSGRWLMRAVASHPRGLFGVAAITARWLSTKARRRPLTPQRESGQRCRTNNSRGLSTMLMFQSWLGNRRRG